MLLLVFFGIFLGVVDVFLFLSVFNVVFIFLIEICGGGVDGGGFFVDVVSIGVFVIFSFLFKFMFVNILFLFIIFLNILIFMFVKLFVVYCFKNCVAFTRLVKKYVVSFINRDSSRNF